MSEKAQSKKNIWVILGPVIAVVSAIIVLIILSFTVWGYHNKEFVGEHSRMVPVYNNTTHDVEAQMELIWDDAYKSKGKVNGYKTKYAVEFTASIVEIDGDPVSVPVVGHWDDGGRDLAIDEQGGNYRLELYKNWADMWVLADYGGNGPDSTDDLGPKISFRNDDYNGTEYQSDSLFFASTNPTTDENPWITFSESQS